MGKPDDMAARWLEAVKLALRGTQYPDGEVVTSHTAERTLIELRTPDRVVFTATLRTKAPKPAPVQLSLDDAAPKPPPVETQAEPADRATEADDRGGLVTLAVPSKEWQTHRAGLQDSAKGLLHKRWEESAVHREVVVPRGGEAHTKVVAYAQAHGLELFVDADQVSPVWTGPVAPSTDARRVPDPAPRVPTIPRAAWDALTDGQRFSLGHPRTEAITWMWEFTPEGEWVRGHYCNVGCDVYVKLCAQAEHLGVALTWEPYVPPPKKAKASKKTARPTQGTTT